MCVKLENECICKKTKKGTKVAYLLLKILNCLENSLEHSISFFSLLTRVPFFLFQLYKQIKCDENIEIPSAYFNEKMHSTLSTLAIYKIISIIL